VQLALDLVANLCLFGFLAFVLFGIYTSVEAYYYQVRLRPALERDMGFREGTATLWVGRSYHSAVAIESVANGGVFARAGFRAGDVLPDVSHTDLFKLLHRCRGRAAELTVVDGGDGPPFDKRPRRLVRILVPPAGVVES
jgi:hypothetical protein